MAIVFKCKMCGGNLTLTEGSTIAECEYCGSVQTVPKADDDKKLTLFTRANRLRANCEFDKAFGLYEAIVAEFPEEAEAYWGLVLCKYGIEYVDDPATGKKIPTCHRSSFDSIMDDSNFEQALENADAAARKVYREEAKVIEEIRKGIIALSANEEPYDIFICYKETDEKGDRTLDSVLAQELYNELTRQKYRIFFSRITLEDKLGQEYEPYIFAALNSAKIMLVVGTDYEYFNAVWVKNEWSRFLKLMAEDHTKHLIPCFKGIDVYDMPKEFAKLQAQDLGKVGAMQDLLRGIEKLISPSAANTVNTPASNIAELLSLGKEALVQGNWNVASNRYDLALLTDPKCATAHLGKLLAEQKCKNLDELGNVKKQLETNSHFQEALTYADQTLKEKLLVCRTKTNVRAARRRILAGLTAAAAAVAFFFAGWFFVEQSYQNAVFDFLDGELDPEEAYSTFQNFAWYKKDESLLFLAAAGAGDWDTANQHDYSRLVLTEATNVYLLDYTSSYYFDISKVTTIEFPAGMEYIPDLNLSRFYNLTTVIIPEGVTQIGPAFGGCSNLTTVILPDSLTSIKVRAFEGCINLTSISLPKNLTTIERWAFRGCTGLTSITIPASVTEIGGNAFENCEKLKRIYCEHDAEPSSWHYNWNSSVDAKVIWGSSGD